MGLERIDQDLALAHRLERHRLEVVLDAWIRRARDSPDVRDRAVGRHGHDHALFAAKQRLPGFPERLEHRLPGEPRRDQPPHLQQRLEPVGLRQRDLMTRKRDGAGSLGLLDRLGTHRGKPARGLHDLLARA